MDVQIGEADPKFQNSRKQNFGGSSTNKCFRLRGAVEKLLEIFSFGVPEFNSQLHTYGQQIDPAYPSTSIVTEPNFVHYAQKSSERVVA